MGRPWYEPDPGTSNLTGTNRNRNTTGGGGGNTGGATGGGASGSTGVDTTALADTTQTLVQDSGAGDYAGDYTNPNYQNGGTAGNPPPQPPPTGDTTGGNTGAGGNTGGGGAGQTYNWTPDANIARQVWERAGRPETQDVSAWFKNAVEAGVYNPDGSDRWNVPEGTPWEEGHSGYNSKTGQFGPIPSDITGRRQWARDTNSPEDFDRFDEATLMLWEQQIDEANCPPPGGHPNAIYQAYDGSGCVGKPIDSNYGGNQGSGGGGGGGGRGGSGGGDGGGGQNKSATVQERPDYDPTSNYVTERQVNATKYGASDASNVGYGASPANPSGGQDGPFRMEPPAQLAGGRPLNRDRRAQLTSSPGSTTIPSGVIWTTGM